MTQRKVSCPNCEAQMENEGMRQLYNFDNETGTITLIDRYTCPNCGRQYKAKETYVFSGVTQLTALAPASPFEF